MAIPCGRPLTGVLFLGRSNDDSDEVRAVSCAFYISMLINIRLRYSEFDDLRQKLLAAFPHAKNALPSLPPKSVLCMLHQISIYGDVG